MLPAQGPVMHEISGKAPDIALLVLGDSSAASVGIGNSEDGLAAQLAVLISQRTGRAVRWRAAGFNSATSGQIRDHGDPGSLVEGPVNTEVDAALTVILFCFGKASERLRDKRTNITLVILGHAVPLVGRERECLVIGPEKAAQDFEKRAAKGGVT